MQSVTPECTHSGLGSSHFARRYFGNRCFFLFLRLLRCFSSPGSPPYVMYWRMDTGGVLQWVSPFRYLRINGYLLLPEAFRSLSRLSSALSAKASTLRSSSLNLHIHSVVYAVGLCLRVCSRWSFDHFVACFPSATSVRCMFAQLNSCCALIKIRERPRTKFTLRFCSCSSSCFRPRMSCW